MKKIFFLLLLALTIPKHSEASLYFKKSDYSSYVDIHFMGGFPLLGAGVRTKTRPHVFDFSANACFLHPPYSLQVFHLKALYLAYPKQIGPYFGGGMGLLNEPESLKISGSGEGVMGYQWRNGIFLEGNVIVPFKQTAQIYPIWPGITLGFHF